jgi:hypothetical protein
LFWCISDVEESLNASIVEPLLMDQVLLTREFETCAKRKQGIVSSKLVVAMMVDELKINCSKAQLDYMTAKADIMRYIGRHFPDALIQLVDIRTTEMKAEYVHSPALPDTVKEAIKHIVFVSGNRTVSEY